jgi:hypothetical protein
LIWHDEKGQKGGGHLGEENHNRPFPKLRHQPEYSNGAFDEPDLVEKCDPMYLTVAQFNLIAHRGAAYSTVTIAAMIDNHLHRKYAFHTSVPAFGVAGEVVFECFGGSD